MAWSKEHKEQSKERILNAAAAQFAHRGFDAVSIDDVMQSAGLTRGAFYSHFNNKSELYANAIAQGAVEARKHMKLNQEERDLKDFAQSYLKIGQKNRQPSYCSLAFMITDICHRDAQVKATYTRILKGFQAIITEHGVCEDIAIQTSIMLIGALALSNAIDDIALKTQLLESSYQGILKLADI